MAETGKAPAFRFGRHQTFPMRFTWPTKGYRYWCEGHDVYDHTDPSVVLGVGKNMVSAIKYWLQASGLVEERSDFSLTPSEIGTLLLSPTLGHDPYLEDDASLWLLHWNIATNQNQATSFYWFFNHFHKLEFRPKEVVSALEEFLKERTNTEVASTTLESDISVLLRMYTPDSIEEKGNPLEDSLQSPMKLLGLIETSSDSTTYRITNTFRPDLPLAVFGYSLLDVMERLDSNNVAISRLLKSEDDIGAPGTVFKLNEEGLVSKLEELAAAYSDVFEIRETAGIHQVYRLKTKDKIALVAEHFREHSEQGSIQ